ncbi:MAG TPA: hypothetical protein VFS54_03850 [Solirubrobacterales bacterium]|nr:hypothetical protein [Solirubrobacterales bacterium]
MLVAAVGCGDSEGPRSTSAGPPAGAEVRASDDEDIQIGADLKRYLIRNCPAPGTKPSVPKEYRNSRYFSEIRRLNIGTIAFCESIATIEVDDGRVMVRTDLKENARGRAAGEGFCLLVQGSDVADFTPGHELQDIKGETIKVCEARTA